MEKEGTELVTEWKEGKGRVHGAQASSTVMLSIHRLATQIIVYFTQMTINKQLNINCLFIQIVVKAIYKHVDEENKN